MSTDMIVYNDIGDNTAVNTSNWTLRSIGSGIDGGPLGCYDYYNHYHWPTYHSCSCVTLSVDKGKQAFELVKKLQDMKVIKLTTVKQFVDTMDAVLKIL